MPAKIIGCGILRRVVRGVESVGWGKVEDAIVGGGERGGEKEVAGLGSQTGGIC